MTVLVIPPSPGELERRLRGRSTESDEAIRLRLAAARAEVARAALRYEYVLVNDRLEEAVARLVAISRTGRARRAGLSDRQSAAIAAAAEVSRVDLSAWGQ
jgi:guanylate kinase